MRGVWGEVNVRRTEPRTDRHLLLLLWLDERKCEDKIACNNCAASWISSPLLDLSPDRFRLGLGLRLRLGFWRLWHDQMRLSSRSGQASLIGDCARMLASSVTRTETTIEPVYCVASLRYGSYETANESANTKLG